MKYLGYINTVRLNDKGLATLDDLGKVVNVVRIGVFHGRHDSFYLDRYHAKLWALPGMKHDNQKLTDIELTINEKMPFPDCSLFVFETSTQPEAILYLNREGGILITCDSIKNWVTVDEFFSKETGEMYANWGLLGTATISKVWQHVCNVQAQDFVRLKQLNFKHLLSAHGEPLLEHANEKLALTIKQEFGI